VKSRKRNTKNFVVEDFLVDLARAFENFWLVILIKPTIDDHFERFIRIFKNILDKHTPLKILTKKEKKLNQKPWITKNILNLIKQKNVYVLFKRQITRKQVKLQNHEKEADPFKRNRQEQLL